MTTERRKHPRFPIDQFIEMDMGREIWIEAAGVNISENGLLCKTAEYCEPYLKVLVTIKMQEGNKTGKFTFEGIVIRSEKHSDRWDTGIEITGIGDKDKQTMVKFINTLGKGTL